MKQVKASRIMAMFLSMVLMVTTVMVPSLTTEAATKVTAITLNVKSKVTMYTGSSQTIKVKSVKPAKASKKVSFKSSNPSVVKITSKGKMTALDAGKATITVTSKSNKKVTKKVTVTVKDLVKKVTEDQAVIALDKGKTLKLSTNVKASNLKFKSSKSSVASVNSKGVVTGKKAGTAKITVTGKKGAAKGGKQVITVYVAKKSVKSISLNTKSKTVKPGESFTLKATINPKGASKAVVFTTSNKKVATVSAKGKVKALKVGKAKITVATIDGKKKATCTVKVVAQKPTTAPTTVPTATPTVEATVTPTAAPSGEATATPTVAPSGEATATPTAAPSGEATATPTATPSGEATATPTAAPSGEATTTPTAAPTGEATTTPTATPTGEATTTPTAAPTGEATATPTAAPTGEATTTPTATPTGEATVTPTAEPTKVPETPTSTPTPSGDENNYVYTFSKTATSYTISKKGADYVVAVSKDDLKSDIETGKAELQNKPLTNSMFMEKWNTLSKDKLTEKSEVLKANKTLLRNFEITDGEGEGNEKTITVTKDGKKYVAVVTPNDKFTEVTIQVTTTSSNETSQKNIKVSDITVTETENTYEITGKINGLMSNVMEVKAILDKEGESLTLQKKTAGNYNTVLTYEETESDYQIKVNKIYAGELCDAMSIGNVFESITVNNTK